MKRKGGGGPSKGGDVRGLGRPLTYSEVAMHIAPALAAHGWSADDVDKVLTTVGDKQIEILQTEAQGEVSVIRQCGESVLPIIGALGTVSAVLLVLVVVFHAPVALLTPIGAGSSLSITGLMVFLKRRTRRRLKAQAVELSSGAEPPEELDEPHPENSRQD